METKTCRWCGAEKPLDQYSKNRGMPGGRIHKCKACESAAAAAYYERNRERLKAAASNRYAANPKAANERGRNYYATNKAEMLAWQKRYRKQPEVQERERLRHQEYYRVRREELILANREYQRSERGKEVFRKARAREKVVHAEKIKARYKVANALRDGRIARGQFCESCGRGCKTQAHHHKGYERAHWLDVQWLCGPCHKAADKEQAV